MDAPTCFQALIVSLLEIPHWIIWSGILWIFTSLPCWLRRMDNKRVVRPDQARGREVPLNLSVSSCLAHPKLLEQIYKVVTNKMSMWNCGRAYEVLLSVESSWWTELPRLTAKESEIICSAIVNMTQVSLRLWHFLAVLLWVGYGMYNVFFVYLFVIVNDI